MQLKTEVNLPVDTAEGEEELEVLSLQTMLRNSPFFIDSGCRIPLP